MATAIPGLLIGILQTIIVWFQSEKRGYHPVYKDKMTWKKAWKTVKECIWAILMPILILLSITLGICTATESAALACLYSVVIGFFVYKDLKPSDIIPALKATVSTTASVMMIVSCATVFTWVMAVLRIPVLLENVFVGLSDAVPLFLILLLFDLIILVIGTFLDVTPALLLLGPMLVPIMGKFGITAIQFGAMMIVGLAISLVTPPVALCLNACSKICGLSMGKIFKAAIPLLVVNVIVFILVTFVPQVSLWLPHILGYI